MGCMARKVQRSSVLEFFVSRIHHFLLRPIVLWHIHGMQTPDRVHGAQRPVIFGSCVISFLCSSIPAFFSSRVLRFFSSSVVACSSIMVHKYPSILWASPFALSGIIKNYDGEFPSKIARTLFHPGR